MDQLTSFLGSIAKPRYEEDSVDKLNYRVTGYILLATAITLSATQYIGSPLQCWAPAQWQGGWEQYAHDYCFVENTYWLPYEDRIPDDTGARDEKMLNYYQWVPFVLAFQALMMNIPHMIWRMLNWMSGIQVRAVIGMACNPGALGMGDTTAQMIAHHIRDGIRVEDAMSGSGNPVSWIFTCCCGLFRGSFISIVYLLVKLLFIINLALQFLILNWFLGTEYSFWGFGMLSDLLNGITWKQTGHFPRATLCDLKVRQLGNVHNWTIQCVLVMNMLSEKLYIFLWWWFAVVSVITVVNAVWWLFATILPNSRESFIRYLLSTHNLPKGDDDRYFNSFMNTCLKSDGVLVLRLLTNNSSEMRGADVVEKLWNLYVTERKREREDHSPTMMRYLDPSDSKPVSI